MGRTLPPKHKAVVLERLMKKLEKSLVKDYGLGPKKLKEFE